MPNGNINGNLNGHGHLSGVLTIGAGGTSDYEMLENKPQINGHELIDNQTAHELGLASMQDVSDIDSDIALLSQKLPKNYSTDEQNTGVKWIDGKYIYQKSMYVLNRTGAFNIEPVPQNFDKLIKFEISIRYVNYDNEWITSGVYSNDYFTKPYVYNGHFYVECSPNNEPRDIYLTAFYTKNE